LGFVGVVLAWEPAMSTFPEPVRVLLWDVEPDTVDLDRHADYLMERIMGRGSWEAMRWLRRTYPREKVADFVRRRGSHLAPRDEAYWALIAGVEITQRPGGGRPPWAG